MLRLFSLSTQSEEKTVAEVCERRAEDKKEKGYRVIQCPANLAQRVGKVLSGKVHTLTHSYKFAEQLITSARCPIHSLVYTMCVKPLNYD